MLGCWDAGMLGCHGDLSRRLVTAKLLCEAGSLENDAGNAGMKKQRAESRGQRENRKI